MTIIEFIHYLLSDCLRDNDPPLSGEGPPASRVPQPVSVSVSLAIPLDNSVPLFCMFHHDQQRLYAPLQTQTSHLE